MNKLMTETILDSLNEQPDPDYGKAWEEGVLAFNKGVKTNPYPERNLKNHSWNESKMYLGWNDGFHHAPIAEDDKSNKEIKA